MLNYENLNDVEFEYLCQDVMERKLGIPLRRFAPGRDGGIDLRNNSPEQDVIVQVKHYMHSTVSDLMSSLRNEITKIKKLRPAQYYVCCSKQLSPQRVNEIYSIFSEYMNSPENVVTLTEIEDFLVAPQNIDILRKHYKLWISSTGILEDIYSNDIFIDSESLLSNIQAEETLFVQTSAYDKALECLEKHRCLLIMGSPGVGKTVTSKMLILHFASQGYRVRYTTDGNNLSDLKKSLSQSPEAKEIILLDDCLGQAYFNMKETQGNELLSIIRHIRFHKNKILLLNSRVTIYQEAKERTPELVKSFETKEYKVFVIDMDSMPLIEKAKILYNHLFFNQIDRPYFEEIKKEKRYLGIVKHNNYNPRIIEFVTNPHRISSVPVSQYYMFILEHLNNPNTVWEDEYTRRLTPVDRILLTTLYSITNTTAPYNFVKQCFEYRLSRIPNIDLTLDNFKNAIRRLQKSFIRIMDVKGTKMLSMANPSINDFIDSYLSENIAEKNCLTNNSHSVRQKKRMLRPEAFSKCIAQAFADYSVLDYFFEDSNQRNGYITYYISAENILDEKYRPFLIKFLSDMHDIIIDEKTKISVISVVENLTSPNLVKYYELKPFFLDPKSLKTFLNYFELEDLVKVIAQLDSLFSGQSRDLYVQICKNVLENAISWYCIVVNIDNYDIDINTILDRSTYHGDWGEVGIDTAEAANLAHQEISDMVMDEIFEFLSAVPKDIQPSETFIDNLSVEVNGCDDLIDSYIKADYDYDDDFYERYNREDTTEIDSIFNR